MCNRAKSVTWYNTINYNQSRTKQRRNSKSIPDRLFLQDLIWAKTELRFFFPVNTAALISGLIETPWHYEKNTFLSQDGKTYVHSFNLRMTVGQTRHTFGEFVTERTVESLPAVLPAHSRAHEGPAVHTALYTISCLTHWHITLRKTFTKHM